MNISIISVGKIKEKSIRDAIDEYIKRISRFSKVNITEINDRPIPDNASKAEEEIILRKEGEDILSKIGKSDYVIAMCIEGKMLPSVDFADKMQSVFMTSSNISFVIGGSLGLSDAVKNRSDFKLSLSPMTFPHNLAKLMLLEQIYRTFKINNNETYHK